MTNKNKKEMVEIKFEIPKKLLGQLNKLCKRTGGSFSEVAEVLLDRGYSRYKEGDFVTVFLAHSLHWRKQ